jgi:cyclopropane-fatty-acyl-phospholipid synthase
MTTCESAAPSPFAVPSACIAPPAGAPASARLLFTLLARLARGDLNILTPAGTAHRFGPGAERDPAAGRGEFAFHDWRLPRDVLTGGDVAFAQAYIDGRWDTPDLAALLTVLAHNQAVLARTFYGSGWRQALFRVRHWLNGNTKRQARRNIVAHYDLGNDFYQLWLDPTMTYSSALFGADRTQSLAAAQQAKYERILRELALPAGAHILEIGCGWGGFAETAARAGYRVTGLSLSDAQTEYARARLASAGLADRVEFRIEDYRDARGVYDGVASIEMFEAVGEKYWPAYFATLRRSVRTGGRACVQAITIADARFDRYRTQSDFIQQYIFPGGMLASPSRIVAAAAAARLELATANAMAGDYAETLRRWLAAFDAGVADVRAQGFDERFVRCWRFYLAYCIAGFESASTDVAQVTLTAR